VHTCTGNLPHLLRDRTSAALEPHVCACWDRTPPACCTRARVAEWSARVHSARAQFLTDSALRFASTHCTSAPMPPVSAIACLVSGWTCSVHCQWHIAHTPARVEARKHALARAHTNAVRSAALTATGAWQRRRRQRQDRSSRAARRSQPRPTGRVPERTRTHVHTHVHTHARTQAHTRARAHTFVRARAERASK
jgi:hypothetical protein